MKRRLFFLALGCILTAALPARAQTTTYVYDQQYTAGGDIAGGNGSGETIGQSFTPTASAMNTAVFYPIVQNPAAPAGSTGYYATFYVQVLDGDGLGGAVLGQSADVTVPVDNDDALGQPVLFRFPATVALTPGDRYTLALATRRVDNVSVEAGGTQADGYAGGQAYTPNGYAPADYDFQEGFAYPVSVTAVHVFNGTDGSDPYAAPIVGNDGNLYGTATDLNTSGSGTVYMLSPDGTTFHVLHTFNGSDGADPEGGLLQASDGFLYGTTTSGGANGGGTVFKVSTDGTTFATLCAFSGSAYSGPAAGLIQADDGFLYGTTDTGGASGDGTVFGVSTDGTTFRTVHSFSGGDGAAPRCTLVEGLDGNLYGTTDGGGANYDGVVFMVSRDGQTFEDLHTFAGSDGFNPAAGLLQASDGNLYGTCKGNGGGRGEISTGTVYMVSTDGTTFTILHTFDGSDGISPDAGLIQASDGFLYGTTVADGAGNYGTAFMISRDGQTFNTLYAFSDNVDGGQVHAGLVQAGNGNFYGAASAGGNSSGDGTVYGLDVSLPDVVRFHASINSVNETAGTAMVRVDRIGDDSSKGLIVPYTLTDGTAKVKTDYTDGGDGELRWLQGDVTPKFITVNIVNRGFTDGSLRTLGLALGTPEDLQGSGTALGYPTTATLTINGSIPGAPVITSAQTAVGYEGVPFSYQIVASATPTTYGFQGDPNGLSIDPQTGLISGTPKAAHGALSYTLNAYNAKGKGSAPLTITFAQAQPTITSTLTANATANSPFSYQITASGGDPQRFGVTGLPAGLSVDPATGILSGTRKVPGPVTMTLNAFNSAGEGSASLTINVAQEPVPTITSATTAMETAGQPFSYTITADNNPTSFGVQGLPSGLSVDASTGQITGTRKVPGTVNLTLNAYNSTGKGSQPLTLTVSAAP